MEIESHDENYFDEGNGIDLSDESQQPPMPENTPIKTSMGGEDSYPNAENTQNSGGTDEKVAEKVEGGSPFPKAPLTPLMKGKQNC